MNNLLRTRVPIGVDDEQDGPLPIAAPDAVEPSQPQAQMAVAKPGPTPIIPTNSVPEEASGATIAPKQFTPIGGAKLATDQAELQRLQQTGSGIDQYSKKPGGVGHKIGSALARIGDVAGSALFPTVMPFVPGTTLHHDALVNQSANRVANDLGTSKQEADVAHTNAEAKALASPTAGKTPEELALHDLMAGDNGAPRVNPDTSKPYSYLEALAAVNQAKQDTKPDKAKTIEEQAYEFALKGGKSPMDALSAVYGAKNNKDAGLPQQYLDAISSGDTTKAALIKRAINDTQTAPKIQVSTANNEGKAGDRENARMDKSYQFNAGALTKISDPVEQQAARMGRLQQTIDQATPQADALIAPELLTVMAGGAGSGLRMNEAEIARVVGGRSNFESLKASLNKWQADPSKALSVTPAQRGQIRSLLTEVSSRLVQKRQVVEDAQQALIEANDVKEHRKIVTQARKDLADIDAGTYKAKSEGGGQFVYARDPQGTLHKAPAGSKLPEGWKEEQPK